MADEKDLEGQSSAAKNADDSAQPDASKSDNANGTESTSEVKKDETVASAAGAPPQDAEIPPPPMTKPDSSPSSAEPAKPVAKTDNVQMPVQPRERRSRWESTFAALRYLSSISRDTGMKLRDTDRATSYSLLVISILTLISLFVPQLAMFRFNLLAVCDVLAGVTIVFYLANRFGIMTTLPPRAALLTWQLILGAWFIGIFVTINVVLIGFIGQHMPAVPDTQPVHVTK